MKCSIVEVKGIIRVSRERFVSLLRYVVTWEAVFVFVSFSFHHHHVSGPKCCPGSTDLYGQAFQSQPY